MKIVYSTDKLTREYLKEVKADPSPLEPGVYYYPYECVEIPPPPKKNGFARVWDELNLCWIYVEDHRGKEFWDEDNQKVVIQEIGSIPDGLSDTPLPLPPLPLPPRQVLNYDFVQAAEPLLAKIQDAAAKGKLKDRLYWERKLIFVEGNPKLQRIMGAAGVDIGSIFDVVLSQKPQ